MGKLLLAVALASALFVSLSPAANAAPRPAPVEAGISANFTDVAVRCGPHAHYVKGHRDRRTHRFIRGRCVRDRR